MKELLNAIGTGREFDIWRDMKRKGLLTFAMEKEFYTALLARYPQKYLYYPAIEAMLKAIPLDTYHVLEIGCYSSASANWNRHQLRGIKSIPIWTGYDITRVGFGTVPVEDGVILIEQSEYIYERKIPKGYDVCLSTEFHEHLTRDELTKTVKALSRIPYHINGVMFADSWDGYFGTHILDMTVKEYTMLYEGLGYKVVKAEPDCTDSNHIVFLFNR